MWMMDYTGWMNLYIKWMDEIILLLTILQNLEIQIQLRLNLQMQLSTLIIQRTQHLLNLVFFHIFTPTTIDE